MKKARWLFLMLMMGIVVVSTVACQEQVKKAEERGKAPKNTVDEAQRQVDAATSLMTENLKQVEESSK